MKFSVALSVVSLAAFAAAQSTSATGSATTSAVVPEVSSSFTPEQQECLDNCPASNVACQAGCLGLPAPNDDMVNATTDCMGKCEQGNGTEAETAKYAACQQACISDHFFTTTLAPQKTGTTGATGTAKDAKATGSASDSSDDADSTDDADSASGSAAPSAADGDSGASGLHISGAVAGIVALAAAAFAL